MAHERVDAWMLCGALVGIWGFVVVDAVARPPATRDWEVEKRPPPAALVVPATIEAWNAFPSKAEAWWSAAMGGRELMLGMHARMRLRLGASPGANLHATEGWIWYDPRRALDARRGTMPLTEERVREQAGTLRAARRICAAQGVRYGYILCPDKETVHADRVPEELRQIAPSRREEFMARVVPLAGVDALDLTAALRDERSHDTPGDPVYFALGSHWSPRGCWRAGTETVAWMERIQGAPLGGLCKRELLWRPTLPAEYHDSWAPALHAEGALQEALSDAAPPGGFHWTISTDASGFQRLARAAQTGPKILLCADSFGPYLAPWLAELAREVVVVPAASLSQELLEAERPDWCFHVVVERTLADGPPGVREAVREVDAGLLGRLPVASRASLDVAKARGGASIEHGASSLRLVCGDGAADGVVLDLGARRGGAVLVLEIESDAAALARVAWRAPSDPGFIRLRSHAVRVPAGRSTIAFEPPELELQGEVGVFGAGLDLRILGAEWRATTPARR